MHSTNNEFQKAFSEGTSFKTHPRYERASKHIPEGMRSNTHFPKGTINLLNVPQTVTHDASTMTQAQSTKVSAIPSKQVTTYLHLRQHFILFMQHCTAFIN